MQEEKPIKPEPKRRTDGTFGPGNVANPNGRPKGKTLKEFAREMLMSMSDEEKLEYLKQLPPEIVWRMSEGNPHTTTDVTSGNEKLGPTLSEEEKTALLALLNEPSKS